jgi:hypothetical protein
LGELLIRPAVRYLGSEAGVRQFLDIGTGIPSAGNTHEVAQDAAPQSRIVYVDNDPYAVTSRLFDVVPAGSYLAVSIPADVALTRYLVDKSALARLHLPDVREELEPLMIRALVGSAASPNWRCCTPPGISRSGPG